ncbi:MAG TPA: hypothetical protein VF363_11700 [Candidatus Eisenbacteria bacterium]
MRARSWLLLTVALLAACSLGGCRRAASPRGASVEREESRGGLRYRVTSRLTPRRVTLGDPVRWTLAAELPAAARPHALLRDSAAASLDVGPFLPPETRREGNRAIWTWVAPVRGFDLGDVALPAARLALFVGATPDTIAFPLDTLAVDSLTAASSGQVVPDRGALPTELRPIDYVVAGLLAALAAAALWLLVRAIGRARARRRAAAAFPEKAEPPSLRLRRELDVLRAEGAALPRDRFYDRLSAAVRDYAAAVTGVPARDRTTRELTRELAARADVTRDAIDALARALDRADLARFARRGGGWEEALATIAEADRLPERLPDPTPAPSATASAAAAAGGRARAGEG